MGYFLPKREESVQVSSCSGLCICTVWEEALRTTCAYSQNLVLNLTKTAAQFSHKDGRFLLSLSLSLYPHNGVDESSFVAEASFVIR